MAVLLFQYNSINNLTKELRSHAIVMKAWNKPQGREIKRLIVSVPAYQY